MIIFIFCCVIFGVVRSRQLLCISSAWCNFIANNLVSWERWLWNRLAYQFHWVSLGSSCFTTESRRWYYHTYQHWMMATHYTRFYVLCTSNPQLLIVNLNQSSGSCAIVLVSPANGFHTFFWLQFTNLAEQAGILLCMVRGDHNGSDVGPFDSCGLVNTVNYQTRTDAISDVYLFNS